MSARKTVIITGAGSGIGRATALRFARDGYNVVLNGRNTQALAEVANEIGTDVVLIAPGDVANKAEVETVVEAATRRFGSIDVVINNAGVVHPGIAEMLNDQNFEIHDGDQCRRRAQYGAGGPAGAAQVARQCGQCHLGFGDGRRLGHVWL